MDRDKMDGNSLKEASPSIRHRLDSGSAARTEGAGRNATDFARPKGASVDGVQERAPQIVSRVERLGFDEALQILRGGGRVARTGWNGRNQFVTLAVGSYSFGRHLDSAPESAHLVLRNAEGALVPWTPSQGDLLSFDWCLVREEKVLVYGHGDSTSAE